MAELRLMIEAMLVSHAEGAGAETVGWMALDVAQWMTDLAATELATALPEQELRKVYALGQVIETVSEALRPEDADTA